MCFSNIFLQRLHWIISLSSFYFPIIYYFKAQVFFRLESQFSSEILLNITWEPRHVLLKSGEDKDSSKMCKALGTVMLETHEIKAVPFNLNSRSSSTHQDDEHSINPMPHLSTSLGCFQSIEIGISWKWTNEKMLTRRKSDSIMFANKDDTRISTFAADITHGLKHHKRRRRRKKKKRISQKKMDQLNKINDSSVQINTNTDFSTNDVVEINGLVRVHSPSFPTATVKIPVRICRKKSPIDISEMVHIPYCSIFLFY